MATTHATNTTSTSESALTPEVRRKLKSTVLDLRHVLEDDFRRQLAAVAVTEDGARPLPAGRVLTPEQRRVRDVAVAVLKREVDGGASQAEAFATLLRESVFTFLNRAIGLRCLEARRLLLVNGQTETAITRQEELGDIPSLYWRVRNMPGGPSQPREIWRETYRRACEAVSRDIRVLFDPEAEYAALFPLQPAMQRVVDALNDPMIPAAVYAEDALLGWVYQYFQSEEKDRIFAEVRTKKKKIGGADIIPVTQLYTEQYMVDFLLQNSLGRTWMEMYPDSRAKAAWPYYVEPATPHSRPRKPLKDWSTLDPCVGSGHFLIVAFDLLTQLYAEERALGEAGILPLEETVPPDEVAQTILERNLYGIDIDRRATQIATLALYLKAREMGLRHPPRINIVAADASFLAGPAWEKFLAGFEREPSVRRILEAMAGYLKDIRELGSLLRPEEELKRLVAEEHKKWELAGRPQQAGLFAEYEQPRQERLAFEQVSDETFWEHLAYRAETAIQAFYDSARASGDLDEQIVAGEAQRGFAFLEMCQRRYDVVCTNPPYMGAGNMAKTLKDFVAKHYAPGKDDLYAAFILRCVGLSRTDGYTAMVTQQAWMFLRSFADLRAVTKQRLLKTSKFPGILRSTSIEALAQLGTGAFAEISGEVVTVALFTLRNLAVTSTHQLSAIRATGQLGNTDALAEFLKQATCSASVVYHLPQSLLLDIDESPLLYWFTQDILRLLANSRQFGDTATVSQGQGVIYPARFLRYFWEVQSRQLTAGTWAFYSKGGGYKKWAGLCQVVIDWSDRGESIVRELGERYPYLKDNPGWLVREPGLYFQPGLTYTDYASGNMSCRIMDNTIFSDDGPGVFSASTRREELCALLNSRLTSFILRATSPTSQHFRPGYVRRLPLPEHPAETLQILAFTAIQLKQRLVSSDPIEAAFIEVIAEPNQDRSQSTQIVNSILHSVEGATDRVILDAYGLNAEGGNLVIGETGVPADWHPLIAHYDALPELSADLPPVPQELTDYLAKHERATLVPEQMVRLKDRLRALYIAGPGAKVEDETAEDNGKNGNGEEGDEEEASVALGARIPIPAETFLEELSQKLEVHPISVYWLLEEMRREEGLVCPPEMKRQMEDYASVTLLRELGFRWPEQDTYEAEHGPILDPALVVEDGILPLVECGTGATAVQQLRLRLERDFGEEGAAESEAEFRKWVGRPLEDWLRRDFFKRHISQFKQRPIAWHVKSKEGTFEAFVLYHKLCDEATGRATLQRLRTQYAGGLIERLRGEQERAKAAKDEREVTKLQIAIEDVEEFRDRLEQIERGDDLKARIRCRWKGDEAKVGRPGPYTPDINDGVKVNVRPFQELGLLSAQVIKKWD